MTAAEKIVPRLIPALFAALSEEQRAAVRSRLGEVPGDDEGRRELWESFERNQTLLLYCVNGAGKLAFFIFVEIDCDLDTSRRECFVRAALSEYPADLFETLYPQLEAVARSQACDSIAAKTERAGLIRKLAGHGWRAIHQNGAEILCRKVLTS